MKVAKCFTVLIVVFASSTSSSASLFSVFPTAKRSDKAETKKKLHIEQNSRLREG